MKGKNKNDKKRRKITNRKRKRNSILPDYTININNGNHMELRIYIKKRMIKE
jgi:hypothetical protein